MKWLKNFERLQELQQQIIWRPITELEPRSFIPEVCDYVLRFVFFLNFHSPIAKIVAVAGPEASTVVEYSGDKKYEIWD